MLNHVDDFTSKIREGIERKFRELGWACEGHSQTYQKPYPFYYDSVAYPVSWCVPDFMKFDGEGPSTTWRHISQYLAQLGEAGSIEPIRVCFFSLSLTGTIFSWFLSLAPNSIFN